jgi:hypothetical protein
LWVSRDYLTMGRQPNSRFLTAASRRFGMTALGLGSIRLSPVFAKVAYKGDGK